MADKQYLSAQSLLEDAFHLGAQILNSDFRPTFIIAVWRGGVPMGIAVQEFLDYHGVHTDNIAIRTSSYHGIDQQSREVRVHGRSVEAIIQELKNKARLNTPHDIRVAVPYYKPSRNEVEWEPHFYLHSTDAWLKYPHSLEGLTADEIAANRPALYEILKPHLK